MDEKCMIAEAIVAYAVETEKRIKEIDARFERVALACAPSGYVGCSQECRGTGDRRRGGYMEEIAVYLNGIGRKKDDLILAISPLVGAFEELRNTRSGHVIYWRMGQGLSAQEYGKRFNMSRRNAYRRYIRALGELYILIQKNGGSALIEHFRQ